MAIKRYNLDELTTNGKALIGFYRQHPCVAVYDLFGVDLAPIQRLVFRDMWFKNYVIAIASRGLGKTYLLGLLATLSALLYPGNRIGLIGPVFRQSLALTNCNHSTFWTSAGLKTGVENFYNSVIPRRTKVQSNHNKNKVISKWRDKDKACKYIKTTKGFELSGTIDHAILVLDDKLNIDFRDLQDIKNEYIVINTGFNCFGNNNKMPKFDEFIGDWRTKDCLIPNKLTPDLSYWMGLLVGDGCVSISKNKRKQRIDFVNEDQDLLASFENILRKYFCVDKDENISCRNRKNNTYEMEYYCKKLIQYFLKCGFTKTTALDKKIPYILKKASRENLIAFIQGLMDTDGGVYIQNGNICSVHFSTSSKQLAKEVQSVLLNLGIISHFGISKKAGIRQLSQGNKPSKCAEAYKIRITGQTFIKRYNDIIGFRCLRKKEKLENYINTYFSNEPGIAKAIGLPNSIVKNNSRKCQEFYNQGLYFVKVTECDYFFSDTIDIEVENEHCYWANGFINHNSKMIFHEVEKLYDQSSILREATAKRPIRGTDACYLKFKSVAGKTPSYIEGVPLGDGCLSSVLNYLQFENRFGKIDDSHDKSIENNHYVDRKESVWGNGKLRESDRSLCNGVKDTIKITTKKGFKNEGTPNHRFKIVRDGSIKWCRFDEFIIGDKVLIDRSYRWHNGTNNITKEQAYAVGFLIGDGCWTDRRKCLSFATKDKELLPALIDGIGCDYLYHATDDVHYIACDNAKYITQNDVRKKWMDFWKIKPTYAVDKKLPKKILSASRENMSACLSGLYDSDGHIQVSTAKGGTSITVGFTNTSEELINQLQYILLHYGIVSTKMSRDRNENWNTVHELLITGSDVKIFYEEIGFKLKRKQSILKTAVENKVKWVKIDAIPDIKDDMLTISSKYRIKKGQGTKESRYTSSSKIKRSKSITQYMANCFITTYDKYNDPLMKNIKLLADSDVYYDEIVSIGEGEAVTYDIHVPDGNEYCANGFYSHNSKIRGSRFYTILVDELAQVPDKILDMVLRPMGATSLAPMERVRRLEEQTKLINAGLATAEDFEEESVNKMIMTSSGYYKFNHMWRRMKDHWKMVIKAEEAGKESDYAVWQVPYWDLPEGFLDMNNINEAKRIMNSHEYSMEYEAMMVSDSEGFFKASLLDDCTAGTKYTINLIGEKTKQYIIGIDPNQGGAASCGVIIIEAGKPNKIVSSLELKSKTTQELTMNVQKLCENYNVLRIFMDKGGGGKAVMDLLDEGYGNKEPIIDRTDQDKKHKDGRHILEMVNFSPAWISDANFTTKAMLEDKSLVFPELFVDASDLIANKYKGIEVLKSQLLSIVVTQTTTGVLHFDTPSKNMNKDLYSALILAAHGARLVERELEDDDGDDILHNEGGMVRQRTGTANFDYLGSVSGTGPNSSSVSRFGLGAAVLQKKKK